MRVAIVPALDEGRAIGSVVLRVREHVDRILVVDDGSRDDTSVIARLAGAEVLAHEHNRGKGAALATGMGAALGMGATTIVLIDGDGQHDAHAIPTLIAPIEAGDADVVVGSRSLAGDGKIRAHRRAGRKVLDRATNAVSGMPVSDTQSGFRAISAAAAERLMPRENGMGVESMMLVGAKRNGLRVVEVPIAEHYPSDVRRSTHPVRHGASVLGSLLRFVREDYPLAFFGGLGAVFIAWGMWSGYLTASHYYATNEFWPGKAMIAMLTLILGTIGVLGGMILDYLNLRLPRP